MSSNRVGNWRVNKRIQRSIIMFKKYVLISILLGLSIHVHAQVTVTVTGDIRVDNFVQLYTGGAIGIPLNQQTGVFSFANGVGSLGAGFTSSDEYLYAIAWSDDAVQQYAILQLTGDDAASTVDLSSGSNWEVFATGIDFDSLTPPSPAVIQAQIAAATWSNVATTPPSTVANPGLLTADAMWFDSGAATTCSIGSISAGDPFCAGFNHDEFLIFRRLMPQLPAVTIQLAGVKDDFAPPTDPASPSPDLATHVFAVGDFDETISDRNIGHRFTGLSNIKSAILRSKLKPLGVSDNDNFTVEFVDAVGINGSWGSRIGDTSAARALLPLDWTTSNFPNGADIVIDLSALPQNDGTALNLLPLIRTNGFLDVRVQDDTSVDYYELETEQFLPGCESASVDATGSNILSGSVTLSCGALWSHTYTASAGTSPNPAAFLTIVNALNSNPNFTSACAATLNGTTINITCTSNPLGNEPITIDFDGDSREPKEWAGAYVNGLTFFDSNNSFDPCQSTSSCMFQGVPMIAEGNAQLSKDGNGNLVVGNIGSSGLDGISIDVSHVASNTSIAVDVLSLDPNMVPSGAYIERSTMSTVNGALTKTSTYRAESDGANIIYNTLSNSLLTLDTASLTVYSQGNEILNESVNAPDIVHRQVRCDCERRFLKTRDFWTTSRTGKVKKTCRPKFIAGMTGRFGIFTLNNEYVQGDEFIFELDYVDDIPATESFSITASNTGQFVVSSIIIEPEGHNIPIFPFIGWTLFGSLLFCVGVSVKTKF